MTREERDNAIRCIKKWIEKEPYLQTYKTCLEALEQCQITAESDHPSCDRNICISNEYNSIGCDECICNVNKLRRNKSLPPVRPQEPKIGHWIETSRGFECDQCHGIDTDGLEPPYCKWCGTQMKGGI